MYEGVIDLDIEIYSQIDRSDEMNDENACFSDGITDSTKGFGIFGKKIFLGYRRP